ncbi:hypothetical protein DTO027B9_3366 [Paecilomyces variotii]|nr:hypothetical protein DTO027B9_3366 [Paecilomyces variotii]
MAANPRPLQVSSTARSKLNAFRYTDNKDEPQSEKQSPSKAALAAGNADKENQSSWVNGVVQPAHSQETKTEPSTQTKEVKLAKECPHTPANRIPLADLISNMEDAVNSAPGKELTPDDHVFWQHVPRSSGAEYDGTPATRGKKRRHSSSPPISSPIKEPFDMQKFQSLLRTPQNDMAADLWNNYVEKTTGTAKVELPPPRWANLLSSSPQTPGSAKTTRDSSGLRRSNSCTDDWPSSKAKRRKLCTDEETRKARNIFSRSRSNVLDSGSSKSKISFLVGQIQENLERSSRARKASSDSFPAQEPMAVLRNRSPSPAEGRRNRVIEKGNRIGTPEKPKGSAVILEESSSDFGDDDLDQDLLDLAETAADDPVVPAVDDVETGAEIAPGLPVNVSGTTETTQGTANLVTANSAVHVDDHDEFDDDDEFPDGMEEILAQYDKQDVPAKTKTPKRVRFTADSFKSDVPAAAVIDDKGNGKGNGPAINQGKGSSEDEFEDEDFDLEAIESSMLQASGDGPGQIHRAKQAIKRYLVISITENMYTTHNGRVQPEQILLVQDERTNQKHVIHLRESWFDTPCTKGSYVHLIGEFTAAGVCVVDNSNNMIILHPDHLISATVVADAISCQRRAVLQDRIKSASDLGKPQVYGNIFHEVFQTALRANRWDLSWLQKTVQDILAGYVDSLYATHTSMSEAFDHVMSKMPDLRAWADIFLRAKPTTESVVEDRHNTKASLSINKLLEVEEHVWSPMYGLKGNIDATVQIAYTDGNDHTTLTVPLELKTGRKDSNQAHRAQTALYTLLLSDRYDIEVTFGILYYLETAKTFRIRRIRHEILQMIQARNRLAGFVRERFELPPMIKRPGLCNQCYSKTSCFIYHKLVDDGDGETSGLGDKFLEVVGHLTKPHQDFFRKWDLLLTKEEKHMMRFRRELWTMLSTERESLGRCFSNVVIEPGSAYEESNGPKINRFRYTFVKQNAPPGFSFGESQITLGEPIVISDERGHFALANGYVVKISPRRITVAVDRRLHNARTREPGFDAERNQTFKGIMEVSRVADAKNVTPIEPDEQVLYRLDKDEFSNGMATVRNNIICMMEKDLFQARQLRRLIIEGEPPSFKQTSSAYTMSQSVRESLNVDQKQAIEKVMSAKDYALVLGMPGTGKTTTIAHIIRALVTQGKSVLLTSYTHTAVDNILLKIKDDNIRILRIGATAKVHPEVQQFADLAAVPKKTIEELQESYEQSRVVATTCLGVNHTIFKERIFDYCIVDEASQITLPVCLGPIRMARTFILVGDHYQLPPLVQNKEAQEGGLDVSLFKLLSDAHPSSVVNLEHQYRMCEEIMLLSNTLIYSGHLKCGTPEVASRSLRIPGMGGLKKHHVNSLTDIPSQKSLCLGTAQGRCWLRDLLEPSAKTRLVNTDTLEPRALETANGSRIVNAVEANVCAQLVESFISAGIEARDIGVITFYRSQLSLLKQNLRHHLPDLEMHTADKFQGRDKEVIILSCVRSNPDKNVGELLRDWRRVNVAFTRARTKLLVVGSMSTLRDGNELLGKYVKLVSDRGWVYDLPKDAVSDHLFDDYDISLSQTQRPLSSPEQPKSSPSQKKGPRNPLSPVQPRQAPKGIRKPEKRGAKMMDAEKIMRQRPILRDMMNDVIG